VVGLIAIGLGTALIASFSEIRPEIVVETCSFVVALLLVVLDRRSAASEQRRVAITRVAEELLDNAEALCGGIWAEPTAAVMAAARNKRDGLRIFYPHLATAAVTAGLLGRAFAGKGDLEVARRLQRWRAQADECNARLSMAELLLFFLPSTREGMEERLRLHVSIAGGPIERQREELADLVDFLVATLAGEGMPSEAAEHLRAAKARLLGGDAAETTTRELEAQI
jgi:hypothetical protein